MEDDYLIKPVEELGLELPVHKLHHLLPHLILPLGKLEYPLASDIGGHYYYGILEIHRAPVPVREPAVIQYLEQQVENIWMRFDGETVESDWHINPISLVFGHQINARNDERLLRTAWILNPHGFQ